jgi:hypothetical protein
MILTFDLTAFEMKHSTLGLGEPSWGAAPLRFVANAGKCSLSRQRAGCDQSIVRVKWPVEEVPMAQWFFITALMNRSKEKAVTMAAVQFRLRRRINELFYLLGYLDAQPMRDKQ